MASRKSCLLKPEIRPVCPRGFLSLVYKVRRNDALQYTTSNIDDILREDNSATQKITALTVASSPTDSLKITLDFDVESPTELQIEGEDRNAVFVLFSDVKNYLQAEINVCRSVATRSFRMFLQLISLLLLTTAALSMVSDFRLSTPIASEVSAALGTNDLSRKLNYLIQREHYPSVAPIGFLVGLAVLSMIMLFGDQVLAIINSFFPANLFLIGKERDKFDRNTAWRGKLVWGIGIAFAVSFTAGVVVWYLTKTPH